MLGHPIRNCLAHPDAGDLPYLIVQALQVLNVHRCHNIDPGISQHFDILPSFCAGGAWNIGVGKFVHKAYLRMPCQNCIGIHFLENRAAIQYLRPRYHLQSFRLCNGVFPAVRLKIADRDIHSLRFQILPVFEHMISFAHTCGITHVQLQLSAIGFRHVCRTLLREDTHVHATRPAYQFVHWIAPGPSSQGLSMTDKQLGNAPQSGKIDNRFDGIFSFQDLDFGSG